MIVDLYTIQITLTVVSVLCFLFIVLYGTIMFDYSNVDYSRFPTFSEIIATITTTTAVYGTMIFLYGSMKLLAIVTYIAVESSFRWMIAVSGIVHIIGFIVVGMINVIDMPHTHFIVAAITFISGIMRSIALYAGRMSRKSISAYERGLNTFYIAFLVFLALLTVIDLKGFIEWVLIIFLLMENVFQIFDFRNTFMEINVRTL